jgi:hypothetical protein
VEKIMPSYHFRIKFRIHRGWFLDHDKPTLEVRVPLGQGTCILASLGGIPIKEAEWLFVKSTGDGFPSREEAVFAGRRAKDAIRWCSAKLRVGVDLGDDKVHGGVSDYLKEKVLEEDGVRALNEPHGLMVYEEDPHHPTPFFSASGNLQVGRQVAAFEEHFVEALNRDLGPSEKESLAFELYGLSYFEATPRARFLTLISAVETIMEFKPRSTQVLEHVENLVEATKSSGLPRSEIDSILGSLSWLRQESISKAGKTFTEELLGSQEYGGKSAKNFFQYCYNIRSELMHHGRLSDHTISLGHLVNRLDELVADLLAASLTRHRPHTDDQ